MRFLRIPQLLPMVMGGLFLAACSTPGTSSPYASSPANYPPANYAHYVGSADLNVYWNCSQPEPGLVQVDGVVQDRGDRGVKFIELSLVGVNSRDGSVAQAKTSLPDTVLYTNQLSPFRLGLQTVGSEARFDLYYQYEKGPGFKTVPNFARDACSPTQHLTH